MEYEASDWNMGLDMDMDWSYAYDTIWLMIIYKRITIIFLHPPNRLPP